mgnify:CR=1 FL=1
MIFLFEIEILCVCNGGGGIRNQESEEKLRQESCTHTYTYTRAFLWAKSNQPLRGCITSNSVSFSETFVEDEEIEILQSLCKHVGLQGEEFIYFGLLFHKNRCNKYFKSKYK